MVLVVYPVNEGRKASIILAIKAKERALVGRGEEEPAWCEPWIRGTSSREEVKEKVRR